MLRLYTSLRLNGTFLGIWLAHTGFGLPLATYLLYGYIASSISSEILESAHTDGATPWVIFTRLVPTRPADQRCPSGGQESR